jgi:3-deoxy-D-arabino-heptulosonate 7-phosphate (DAHP) synthase class II
MFNNVKENKLNKIIKFGIQKIKKYLNKILNYKKTKKKQIIIKITRTKSSIKTNERK